VAENTIVITRSFVMRSLFSIAESVFPRHRSKGFKTVTPLAQVRQGVMCLGCLSCGLALILASPSHHHYRGLELFVGCILFLTGLGDIALEILPAVAAREVKPRKLETE
jgi:hypothetical protein